MMLCRIVAIVAGFGFCVLFLFVPETFWDRTPRPRSMRPTVAHRSFSAVLHHTLHPSRSNAELKDDPAPEPLGKSMSPRQQKLHEQNAHVGFIDATLDGPSEAHSEPKSPSQRKARLQLAKLPSQEPKGLPTTHLVGSSEAVPPAADVSDIPHLHSLNSPWYLEIERNDDYLSHHPPSGQDAPTSSPINDKSGEEPGSPMSNEKTEPELGLSPTTSSEEPSGPKMFRYTTDLRRAPPKTYVQTLRPWNGRLTKTSWFKVMLRPFILFAYPSVLWSTLVYSLSVGWLIVLSESVTSIYRNKSSYNFSALGTGLVYLSPFIGGIIGTAVAGKVSDIIVRFMARRNGGVYEPEFRLVMAIPVAIATAIGLMGFGWSAQERDKWIVPTVFFGIISFGCSLGSTTAITFCVDSYRQYAGEALVTLNFSKNIFHGLVFSLFFPTWLEDDGPKKVFLTIGGIQVACLLTTIPMYIYGKRARMMTVRNNWMEKL